MEARPAAGLIVSALIRRIEAAGGSAMVLARGDATAGALLVLLAERGVMSGMVERSMGVDGYAWRSTGPSDPAEHGDYIARRRRSDPDLWVIELDCAGARAIVEEVA